MILSRVEIGRLWSKEFEVTIGSHPQALEVHTIEMSYGAQLHPRSNHWSGIQQKHQRVEYLPPILHFKYKDGNQNNKLQILKINRMCNSPSAIVFPRKPRSTEMVSSGSFTTLWRKNRS